MTDTTNAQGSAQLSTGAIVGIAVGAGSLFLSAAGLFIIYALRQRRFDTAENFYRTGGHDGIGSSPFVGTFTGTVGPVYTLDYKAMRRESRDSSHSLSPEPTMPLPEFSHVSEMASAMPTHPAYIPRALVRGTTPSTMSPASSGGGHTPQFSMTSSTPRSTPRSQAQLVIQTHADSSDQERYPRPMAGFSRTREMDEDSEDTMIEIGHAEATNYSFSQQQQPRHQRPLPALIIPASTSSRPKPARLNLNLHQATNPSISEKPIKGRENMAISGPLAFPHLQQQQHRHQQQYQSYDESGSSATATTDRRTFRDRSQSFRNSFSGSGSQERSRPRGDRIAEYPNRHYAEIEVGRDSDIW
ncbi:hypothetical protein B0T22DRAFT_217423 [Podospora appendiculata]|uniref:Uncharacterized protein n=1 Tax=Podospora appendiculata TaxID=314037 RepID=A0AAE1CAD7_9PEZI|nr:hypothetical protein B0T22DRAFT_217423 [Podospora appendiculata]